MPNLNIEALKKFALQVRNSQNVSEEQILSAIAGGGMLWDQEEDKSILLDYFEAQVITSIVKKRYTIAVIGAEAINRAQKMDCTLSPIAGNIPMTEVAIAKFPSTLQI